MKEAWQQTGSAVTTPTAGETLAGTGISYAYDGIGNRLTHTEGGRATSTASTDPNGVASSTVTLQDQRVTEYSPSEGPVNAANQYTKIKHPAYFNVRGTRTAGATIAVNGVAIATPTPTATSGYQTGGTGTIFRAEVANTAPAGFTGGTVDLYQPVTITQNGTQLTVDDPVQYVAPPTETLTYDADGNLKTDGRWTYTWDAADRLIKMESIAFIQNASPPLVAVNVPAKVIEFAYDGLSRRIRKKVTETPSGGSSTIAVWEAYVYDGWNMVLSVKLNPAAGATQGRPQSAIASNVWAPDLGSQPFARRDWQKAGGVRGLVLANYFTGANGGGLHVPGMDPMGNVSSVTRLGMSYSAGESPGPYFRSEFVYDYDAFGKETRSSTLVAGLNPDSFPFHFSTKFTDPESGFNYYGYRFYDPANGRWLNRDPIGERGGVNLYGMVGNDPVGRRDRLGLEEEDSKIQNCVGNACGHPHEIQPKPDESIIDRVKREGWNCTQGVSARDCKCHCGTGSRYMMIYVYTKKETKTSGPDIAEEFDSFDGKDSAGEDLPASSYKGAGLDFHGIGGDVNSNSFDSHSGRTSHQDVKHQTWTPSSDDPDYFEEKRIVDKHCCCKRP